jgi:hypothetical protein
MRTTILAAFALAAVCAAAPAHAQANDPFAGTWGFQTEDYGTDDYNAAMSGVAVITPASGNRYSIKLLAQEMVTLSADNQSRLLVARENCTGVNENGQLTVTCELAEPVDNYQPDAFEIQAVDRDHLGGVLTASANASVNFNRVR